GLETLLAGGKAPLRHPALRTTGGADGRVAAHLAAGPTGLRAALLGLVVLGDDALAIFFAELPAAEPDRVPTLDHARRQRRVGEAIGGGRRRGARALDAL